MHYIFTVYIIYIYIYYIYIWLVIDVPCMAKTMFYNRYILPKKVDTTIQNHSWKISKPSWSAAYNKLGVLAASRKMKVSSLILKLFWNTTQYSCINRHLGKCQISRNIAPLNSSLHNPATNHHPGPFSPYPLGPRWFYWHAQCSWLIPTPSTRTLSLGISHFTPEPLLVRPLCRPAPIFGLTESAGVKLAFAWSFSRIHQIHNYHLLMTNIAMENPGKSSINGPSIPWLC